MEKNNVTKLFEEVNLYEVKKINLYTKVDETFSRITDEDLTSFLDYLGLIGTNKLITDCVWCEGHFPFSFKHDFKEFDTNIYSICVGKNGNGDRLYLNLDNPSYIRQKIATNTIQTQLFTVDYYFSCTNDTHHHYFMKLFICLGLDGASIIKIGQFPENSSIGHFVSEEYKKELRKINDSYIDYKNSERSFRHGLYVGAYDYLRRVYEKMIDYYLAKRSVVLDSNSKTQEKIKAIKTCFDNKIQDFLYPLYSALSAGIHKMTEEECKENYNELKTVIDIQLQYIKSETELELQINKSKTALEKLNTKYKKS